MNHYSAAGPLHSAQWTWAPPAGSVQLTTHTADLVPHGEKWHGWVPASALAHLAQPPDAAVTLDSKRGFLHDSPRNQRLADLLRERPEDYGVAGEAIVLWADHITSISRWDGRITLQLHGVRCVNGFQSLSVIACVNCEQDLAPGHLDRARPRVEIHTGFTDDLARLLRLFHESQNYMNPLSPQDNLSLCDQLPRIRAEYRLDDMYFDWRRGVVAGPHTAGHDIAAVFRALACFHASKTPTLAHQIAMDEGLFAVWSDLQGPAYRALMHEGVHALGVQRAAVSYGVARETIAGLGDSALGGQKRLMKYIGDFVVWAAARSLPLGEMHGDPRGSHGWGDETGKEELRQAVRVTAVDAVTAYADLYPKKRGQQRWTYQGTADSYGAWRTIADHLSLS